MTILASFARHRPQLWAVLRDTVTGVWRLGFVHAGNLAYLSLLTLFPFVILVVTVAGSLGRTDDGLEAARAFLTALPPEVANIVRDPVIEVINVRATSGVLTLGVLVTLWSVTGFLENIRTIIRDAYCAPPSGAAWAYRVGSLLVVFVAVVALLAALAAQVLLSGAETFVSRLMPFSMAGPSGLERIVPLIVNFLAIWAVFFALTPRRFRVLRVPIWPGAAIVTLVWGLATGLMPRLLGYVGNYTLTYGSLAGVIIALLFFYIVGLALVVGANLNAALAKLRESQLKALTANLRIGDR